MSSLEKKETKAEKKQLPWSGISPDLALDLEIYLCRSSRRLELLGGNTENVQNAGAPAAAWLLVKATLDFFRNAGLVNIPTNQDLSKLIEVAPSVFGGNLMKGWPGKSNPELWTKKARKVFRYLLTGRPDETPHDDDQERAARRVHEYFFRGLDRQQVPSFLEGERLPFGEPCSVTEIRDEISWLIRKFERTKKPASLVWVSGGLPFFGDDMMGPVGGVTAEAIRAGVEVSFVFASDASNTDAVHNLRAFESKYGPIGKGSYDLADPRYAGDVEVPAGVRREFVHPSLRHLYLSIPDGNGESDDTLFFLRAPFIHGEPRRLPLAIQANDMELGDFQRWFNRIYLATPQPASSTPKVTATGGTA